MLIIYFLLINLITYSYGYDVIYAINAGGEEHRDVNGILYARDPLMDKVGIASDYGRQLLSIGRLQSQDEYLYQTERYHTSTFGYDIPTAADGEYVLILKFCEVYFQAPNMKVFDVVLNGDHTVITDLDIYQQVGGRGIAHDEYVYFSISRGRLFFKGDESDIRGGRIRIEFIKGYRDNPKINAIVLLKGNDIDNIPKLPPIKHNINNERYVPEDSEDDEQVFDQEEFYQKQKQIQHEKDIKYQQELHRLEHQYDSDNDDTFENIDNDNSNRERKTSGPKQEDPYSMDDSSSVMLPVFIAIGAFIPLLFCLCKL